MLLLLPAQNAEALCKRFPFFSVSDILPPETHLGAQPSDAIWIPSKRIACLTDGKHAARPRISPVRDVPQMVVLYLVPNDVARNVK